VPLRLFASREFAIGNLTTYMMSGATFAAAFLLTQEFQLARGYSPLGTGLRLLPFFATPMIVSPLAGALSDRIGRRPIMVAGLALQALGFIWVAAHGSLATTWIELDIALLIAGIGISMALPTVPTAVLSAVAPQEMGKASGINYMAQRFGTVFAIAIASQRRQDGEGGTRPQGGPEAGGDTGGAAEVAVGGEDGAPPSASARGTQQRSPPSRPPTCRPPPETRPRKKPPTAQGRRTMPNILHRLSIDAPPERVHQLAATREGIQRWWTGHPVAGDDKIGEQLAVHFSDPADPAATFEVVERSPEQIVWRCVDGPRDWIDTRIAFALKPRADGGTTLLFSHQGWQQENEFMNGCSTNWAFYLMSLKSGAEGHGFNAYPGGEISRWD
jgi:uncharacterized protein YndB with AHSA1/START domain